MTENLIQLDGLLDKPKWNAKCDFGYTENKSDALHVKFVEMANLIMKTQNNEECICVINPNNIKDIQNFAEAWYGVGWPIELNAMRPIAHLKGLEHVRIFASEEVPENQFLFLSDGEAAKLVVEGL
jgi:hypothetical protein